MFIEFDKPEMRLLTTPPFACYDYKYCKVTNNYHISIDDHYYCVPYSYYSHTVLVRTSPNEILYRMKTIGLSASISVYMRHFLNIVPRRNVCSPNHHYYEENNYTAKAYIHWAASIGPNTKKYMTRIIASFEYEQQSYKSCNGLLHMISKKA